MDIEKMNEMSLFELENLERKIAAEIEKRRNELRQKAWDKVLKAVHDYVAEFGEIKEADDPGTFLVLCKDMPGCYSYYVDC